MNFLRELQGLRGENLTSAALCFLLIGAQDVRDCFIELISKESKQGPIILNRDFSCTLEESMTSSQADEIASPGSGSGRIDLLIKTDDMIIGIENKLWAEFQPGQPEKYFADLEKRASESSGTKAKRYVLVILAPQSRTREVNEIIATSQNSKHYIQVSWETVFGELAKRGGRNLDRIYAVLLDQLQDYIIKPFWPDELSAAQLQGPLFPDRVHKDFLERLLELVPPSFRVGRFTGGRTDRWMGFDFHRDQKDSPMVEHGWLAFVNTKAAKPLFKEEQPHESELLLVTTKSPPSTLSSSLRRVAINEKWWSTESFAWVINYDEDQKWRDRETWRDVLNSVLQ